MNWSPAELAVPVGAATVALAAWRCRAEAAEQLVFVHGLACSKATFRDAPRHAELDRYGLVAFDLPGFGESPRPATWDAELETQAAAVAAVLERIDAGRVHLVAHSMGGTLALLLPESALARLASLVLVEARLYASSCGVAAEASALDFDAFRDTFLPAFRARTAADPRVSFDAGRADPRVFHASATSLMRWAGSGEMPGRFAAAPCPAWFVYGGENATLAELQGLEPGRLREIPGAAHFPMQDDPDAFYRCVAALADGAGA